MLHQLSHGCAVKLVGRERFPGLISKARFVFVSIHCHSKCEIIISTAARAVNDLRSKIYLPSKLLNHSIFSIISAFFTLLFSSSSSSGLLEIAIPSTNVYGAQPVSLLSFPGFILYAGSIWNSGTQQIIPVSRKSRNISGAFWVT